MRLAVREDLGRQNDWTTLALVAPETQGRAAVVARNPASLLDCAPRLSSWTKCKLPSSGNRKPLMATKSSAGSCVAEIAGSARDMLTCERPLLNIIARLSGIATLTRQYVRRIEGTAARIYDTRKTAPGWRRLEKYAVRCGGGYNHRTGLFDAILIKDNHLALAAERNLLPAAAVRAARDFLAQVDSEYIAKEMLVEVEIDRLEQLDAVLAAGPDIVLLDNMSPDQLQVAVGAETSSRPMLSLKPPAV